MYQIGGQRPSMRPFTFQAHKRKVSQAGFTLLELLIAISLLAITAGLTGDIILTLVRSYNKIRITNEIEQTGNVALSKLEKELRVATKLITPDPLCATPPSCFCGDTLVFQRTALNNPLDDNDNETIEVTYVIDSSTGSLQRTEEPVYGAGSATTAYLIDATSSSVQLDPTQSEFCTVDITDPNVVSIDFTLLQTDASGGSAFTGTVLLNQVLVLRGTY